MTSSTSLRSISLGDLRQVAQSQSGVGLAGSSDEEEIRDYCRPALEDTLPKEFDHDGAVVIPALLSGRSVRVIPSQSPSPSILETLKRLIGVSSYRRSPTLETLSTEARQVLYMSLFPTSSSSNSSARKDFFEDLMQGIGASSQPLEISTFLTSRNLISVDRRREFARQQVLRESMIQAVLTSETLFGRLVVLSYPTHFSCHVLAHACNIQFLSTEKEWRELFDSLRARAVSQKVHSIVGPFPFQIPLENLFKRHPNFLIPVLKTLDEVLSGRWGGREVQLLRQLFKNHSEFTLLAYQLLNRLHFHPFYVLSHLLSCPNEERRPPYRLGDLLDKQVLELIGMPPLAFFPFSIKLMYENPFKIKLALASPSHFFYREETIELSYPCREEDLKMWCDSRPLFDLRTLESRANLSPSILICQALGGMMGELYAYSTSMTPNAFKDQYIEILKKKYCGLTEQKDVDNSCFEFLRDHPDVSKELVEVLNLYSLLRAQPIVKPKDISQITTKMHSLPPEICSLVMVISTNVQKLVATNTEIILAEFKSTISNLRHHLSPISRGLKDVDLNLPEDWILESEMANRIVSYFSLCVSAAAANAVYGYGTQCLVSQGREGLEENKKLQLSYESLLREPLPDAVKQVLEVLYQAAYIEWTQQGSAVKKVPKTSSEAIKDIHAYLKRLGIQATLEGLETHEDLVQGLAVHVRACVEFRTECMQALRSKTSFNGKAEQFGKIQTSFMVFVQSFDRIDQFRTLMSLANTVLQATYPTNTQVLTDMMVLACRSGQSIKEGSNFSLARRNLNTKDCPCSIPSNATYRDLALYLRGYIPRFNNDTTSTKTLYSCFRVETDIPYGEDGKRNFRQGEFIVGYASTETVAEVAIPLDLRQMGELDFLRTDLFVQELSNFVAIEASEALLHISAGFKAHPFISSLEESSRERAISLFVDFRNRAEQALAEVFFQSTSRLDLTGASGASSRKVRGVKEAVSTKIINLADEIQALQALDQRLKDSGLEEYTTVIRPFYRDPNFREAIQACLSRQNITDKTMFLGQIRQLAQRIWSGSGPEDKAGREAFQTAVKKAQGFIA